MATSKQVNLICELYEELGQDYDIDDIEALSVNEASNLIEELIEMKRELE